MTVNTITAREAFDKSIQSEKNESDIWKYVYWNCKLWKAIKDDLVKEFPKLLMLPDKILHDHAQGPLIHFKSISTTSARHYRGNIEECINGDIHLEKQPCVSFFFTIEHIHVYDEKPSTEFYDEYGDNVIDCKKYDRKYDISVPVQLFVNFSEDLFDEWSDLIRDKNRKHFDAHIVDDIVQMLRKVDNKSSVLKRVEKSLKRKKD